jgi:hypothetical protein
MVAMLFSMFIVTVMIIEPALFVGKLLLNIVPDMRVDKFVLHSCFVLFCFGLVLLFALYHHLIIWEVKLYTPLNYLSFQ